MRKRSLPDVMLADACADGDLRVIRMCLTQGAGAGAVGKRSGKSALAGVVDRHSELGLQALLSKAGEDWSLAWSESTKPVAQAVKRGWIWGALALLDAGFDGAGAALEVARSGGSRSELKSLLMRYRPSQQEMDECVEASAMEGGDSMIQTLLEHGANPDARAKNGVPLALGALRENRWARAIYFARANPNPLLSDHLGCLWKAWSVHAEREGELGELARQMVAKGKAAVEAQDLAMATQVAGGLKKGAQRI